MKKNFCETKFFLSLYGITEGGTEVKELLLFTTDATVTTSPARTTSDGNTGAFYLDASISTISLSVSTQLTNNSLLPIQLYYTNETSSIGAKIFFENDTYGWITDNSLPPEVFSTAGGIYSSNNVFVQTGNYTDGETLNFYGTFLLMDIGDLKTRFSTNTIKVRGAVSTSVDRLASPITLEVQE